MILPTVVDLADIVHTTAVKIRQQTYFSIKDNLVPAVQGFETEAPEKTPEPGRHPELAALVRYVFQYKSVACVLTAARDHKLSPVFKGRVFHYPANPVTFLLFQG